MGDMASSDPSLPLGVTETSKGLAAPCSLRGASGSGRVPFRHDGLTSRFRSLFVVGRGGMGSIEVAIETTDGGEERIVALKRMLPAAVLDKRLTEMFLREAKLASMLDHPNVVHATSFGERDGELFLVMEYIEGEPLSRVVALGHERGIHLALPLVAHILAEICEGLHAVQELEDENGRPLNVVHRDVSPQNVMVAYEGQVKLLDFGVAKIEALEADGRTKTGEVKGKTAYMSPEQAMGDPIDLRSDLYSLGAVLFEAVSGKKMWGGGTDLEVLRRMALEEPPHLEHVAPGTPEAICRLHRRLVAREPSKRPSSAMEVARELRTFIASTGTHPDSRVVRSLMVGLFAAEIERRRAALRQAIDQVVPDDNQSSSASLVPALADATPVAATRGLGSSGPWPRSTRTLATAGTAVVAAAVVAGILWRGVAPSAATSAAGAPTATPTGTTMTVSDPASPSPSPAAVPPGAPSTAALPSSTSDTTRPPAASASPRLPSKAEPPVPRPAPRSAPTEPSRVTPAIESSSKTPPREPSRPSASPKPTGPLDVDPAPF
jgi:serine/threonine-protein kinase